MNNSSNTGSDKLEMRSGYDLPVYGLANKSFYYIHIPALFCIYCSLGCVVTVLILSFRQRNCRTFFTWTKSERFIVYLAICDGTFNISHSMDHLQYVILKEHVRPKELCIFYAFLNMEFITAQNLMVNIVAINAFSLMYLKKNINFGKRDWKLLSWMFGVPCVCGIHAAATGLFGPGGSYCLFDAIKGSSAAVYYTTVPLLVILTMNIVMYALTLKRIRQETSSLNQTIQNQSINKSQRAARNMSMFVLGFFVQWGILAVYGVWALVDANVPQPLIYVLTITTNLGGCLNLCIFCIIRRRNRKERNTVQNLQSSSHSAEHTTSTNDGHM